MSSARSIKAGSAFVQFFLDDGPFQRGLKRTEATLRQTGAKIRNLGAGALALGGALATPFVAAIKAAGDFEETLNRFNTLFGENSKAARQFAEEYGKAVGRSQSQLLGAMSDFQGLASGLGLSGEQAAAFSKELTQLSTDFASFNNLADDDAINRFIQGLSGSSEVWKRFGIDTSAAALKLRGVTSESTELEKAMARAAILKDVMGRQGAMGDAINTAGSFTNQVKRLNAILNDTANNVGGPLLKALNPVLSRVVDAARITGDWISNNQELVKVTAMVAAALVVGGGALLTTGVGLQLVAVAISGVSSALKLVLVPMAALKSVMATSSVIASALASPMLLLGGAVAGVAGYFLYASGAVQSLSSFLSGRLASTLKMIVSLLASGNIAAAGNLAMESLKSIFRIGLGEVQSFWVHFKGELAKTFLDLTTTLENAWIDFTGFFSDNFLRAAEIVSRKFNEIVGDVSKVVEDTTGVAIPGAKVGIRRKGDVREKKQTVEEVIAERRAEREKTKQQNREFAKDASETVDQQVQEDAKKARSSVDAAKERFNQAQRVAAGAISEGETSGEDSDSPEAIADRIKKAMDRFVKNQAAAGATVQAANTGVDFRSKKGQEEIARALGFKSPTDETVGAIGQLKKTVEEEAKKDRDLQKKSPRLKVSKT